MDHINNIKMNNTRVLLWYHYGTEKFNITPKKLELVDAVTEVFIKYW